MIAHIMEILKRVNPEASVRQPNKTPPRIKSQQIQMEYNLSRNTKC